MPIVLSVHQDDDSSEEFSPLRVACEEIDLYEAVLLAIVRGDLAFNRPGSHVHATLDQCWAGIPQKVEGRVLDE